MSFLKRLGKSLAGRKPVDSNAMWVHVRCKRCGEAIATRVSLRSDLSVRYDASGQVLVLIVPLLPVNYQCEKC